MVEVPGVEEDPPDPPLPEDELFPDPPAGGAAPDPLLLSLEDDEEDDDELELSLLLRTSVCELDVDCGGREDDDEAVVEAEGVGDDEEDGCDDCVSAESVPDSWLLVDGSC